MAVFTWVPEWSAKATFKPRNKKAQFGDGYAQRIPDGINNNPKIWNVTFKAIDDTTRGSIEQFLSSHGGHTAFTWAPPGEVSAKYICETWDITRVAYNVNDISAVFEQVFE